MLASKEIRQQSHLHTKNRVVTARRLADFLADLSSHEAVRQQRLRDLEGKPILESLGLTGNDSPTAPGDSASAEATLALYPVQTKVDVARLLPFRRSARASSLL
jgi:hypothetical protein